MDGNSDVLSEFGISKLLFEPGNSDNLADKLKIFKDEENFVRSDEARKKYSIDVIFEKELGIYNRLCQNQ